jgi:hypothetical protein
MSKENLLLMSVIQSGLINAAYALPDPTLRLRTVRQRLYRVFCGGNAQLEATIALFNDKRAAIEGRFDDTSSKSKATLKYPQGFYEIMNDPKKRQNQVVDKCREIA